MAILLLLIPLITATIFWTTNNKRYLHFINAIGAALILVVSVFVIMQVMDKNAVTVDIFNNIIYIDSLSGIILLVISTIGFLVAIYSISYMNEELKKKVVSLQKLKIYYSLLFVFMFSMLLTICTQNIGLMWISIEATTLSSAFLVGLYNNKKSIEAAWKYIIICSVGIAFAMLGIVLLYYSSIHTLGTSANGLNWQYLFKNAGSLQGSILKLAFVFILIGFGTKAGFAPMHTWLPDAHSQAPSPISALLSGVLLNTAIYGIIRVIVIVNKNLSNNLFTSRLLIVLGILSVGTAAIFVMVQQDFKRTLAYSTIEHMGIIAFALGIFTPLSIFGALFHIINHAFTKSMLFMASGNVYLKYDTKRISKVNGILKVLPVTGVVFILGLLAITGVPPFSIFSSELIIIIEAITKEHYVATALLLLFLALIFAGFISQFMKMFFGKPSSKETKVGEMNKSGSVILIVLLVIIAVTGLFIPIPLKNLINSAVKIISLGSG